MSSSFAFGTLQGVHVAAVSLGRRALVQQTLPPSTTLKNAAAALLESMDLAGAEDSFVKFVLCTHAAGMDRPLRSLSTVINDLKKHG